MRGTAARPGAPEIVIAMVLSAVAGAVDVVAFTRLGHAFASVITGNVVVIGVSIGQADLSMFAHVATAVICYAIGVLLGSVAARTGVQVTRRWTRRANVLCAAEFVVVTAAALVWMAAAGAPTGTEQYLALGLLATGMGLQSAAFRLVAISGVTTTYFTGTLTVLLAGVATAGRIDRVAASALLALLAGASVAGVLVAHAPSIAALLPVVLLAVVLVAGVLHTRESSGAG